MPERTVSFSSIESADLVDDDRLAELYLDAVHREWWPLGNKAVLEFWCLAEKALQDDQYGTPGRLFHSLIKSKELGRITDGQEQRALQRMPAHAREALVARAGLREPQAPLAKVEQPIQHQDTEPVGLELWTDGSERVVYHHSVMMVCFLPQKRLPPHEREYVVRHGHAALRIEAGTLIDPENVGQFKQLPVPYGSRARMILPYINAYALQHRTRTVDLGRSLRGFMTRIGLSFDGRRGSSDNRTGPSAGVGTPASGSLAQRQTPRAFGHYRGRGVVLDGEGLAAAVTLGTGNGPLREVLRRDQGTARAAGHGPPSQALALSATDGPLFLAHLSNSADRGPQEGPYPVGGVAAGVRSRCGVSPAVQAATHPGHEGRGAGVFGVPGIDSRPSVDPRTFEPTGTETREHSLATVSLFPVSAN